MAMADVKRMYEHVITHFGAGSVDHLDDGVNYFIDQIRYRHSLAAGFAIRAHAVARGQWDALTAVQLVECAEHESTRVTELESIFGSLFTGRV